MRLQITASCLRACLATLLAVAGASAASAPSEGGLYIAGAGFSFQVAAERAMAQNPGGRRFFLLTLPPEAAALAASASPAQRRLRERVLTANGVLLVELAMKAVEIDPGYAMAHAILGEAAATVFQSCETELSWLDRAEKHVAEAERLDPALPDLRVARAKMLWNKVFNFPAETALRELTLALRIDAHHVGALRLWAGRSSQSPPQRATRSLRDLRCCPARRPDRLRSSLTPS